MSTSPSLPLPERTVLHGILFMCAGALVLPFLNASAKYLGAEYPVAQVVWARYAGHLLYMTLLFAPHRGPRLFASRRLGLQVLRSVLLLASTGCYFTALGFISLPMAASISFTSPLMVTLLAIPMLGEKVGLRRWSAAAIGFAGALIVIRPGFDETHWTAFLVVGAALFYALYQILTRTVSAHDPPDTTTIYTAVVGTAVMTVVLPFVWRTPASAFDLGVFLGLGLFASFGHFLIVKAYQSGPASVISPFNYVQLLGAAGLGFLIFGQLPDAWTWVGASLIVGSGVYTMFREQARAQARAGDERG